MLFLAQYLLVNYSEEVMTTATAIAVFTVYKFLNATLSLFMHRERAL